MPAPTGTPMPSPSSTLPPTPTLTPSPSNTPQATDTPAPSPTLEAGQAFALTLTAWPSLLSPSTAIPGSLACRFNWKSPGNGKTYDPAIFFTVGWNVTNTGSTAWTPESVVLTYVGGAKLTADPTVPLDASVSPGESVVLSVRMRAPKHSNPYTTHWSLRSGDTFFCPLTLSIYVDSPR